MTPEKDLDTLLKKHGIGPTDCWSDLPDGWFDIVDRLFADLVAMGWDRRLSQIKEKFAELRVYASGGATGATADEIWARIDEATEESRRTCQECGQPGEQRTTGWWRTLCDECVPPTA
jgi:hypothetical protein